MTVHLFGAQSAYFRHPFYEDGKTNQAVFKQHRMCSVGHMTTRCQEQVGIDANESLDAESTPRCPLHADVLDFGYKQKAHHDFPPKPHVFFPSCPPSRSHDVKTPAPFLCVWQDNKAMNMFGMDHMLKDGWNGWYSQGYMYFDNCSSLFLPKV